MRRVKSIRTPRSARLVAVLAILAVCLALPAVAAARGGVGVPANSSLLFSLDSKGGTLKAVGKPDRRRYVLTLTGVGREVTWFADRPRRDAGRLGAHRLFDNWGRLGFRASPPNAALVVSGARADEDSMAVELRLRHYDHRTRTATFAAREIGSLGGGLRHLQRRLDPHVPSHFRNASLFIDNGYYQRVCNTGQPELWAVEASALRSSGAQLPTFLPAEGQLLEVAKYAALYTLLGTTYGGSGGNEELTSGSYRLPSIPAPAGASWYMCAEGIYPVAGEIGPGLLGEVIFLPDSIARQTSGWLPADGRELQGYQYAEYDKAFGGSAPTFSLPKVPAPAGMTAMVEMEGGGELDGSVGQLRMFVGEPRDGEGESEWVPATGQTVGLNSFPPLSAFLQEGTGHAEAILKLPDAPGPAPGVAFYIAASGYWTLQ